MAKTRMCAHLWPKGRRIAAVGLRNASLRLGMRGRTPRTPECPGRFCVTRFRSMKFDRMQILHYDTYRVEKSILLRGEQLLRFLKTTRKERTISEGYSHIGAQSGGLSDGQDGLPLRRRRLPRGV